MYLLVGSTELISSIVDNQFCINFNTVRINFNIIIHWFDLTTIIFLRNNSTSHTENEEVPVKKGPHVKK